MSYLPYTYKPNSYDHLLSTEPSASAFAQQVLRYVSPKSVADFGGGIGVFLSAFKSRGVTDITVIDGSWVDSRRLVVQKTDFISADLEQPCDLGRQFDLVISLETAEHLLPESAEIFVNTLCRHSNLVAFSAALPGIPGNRHINCQWPSYWARLFAQHDYVPADCIRQGLWSKDEVNWCYIQGSTFYVRRQALEEYPLLTPIVEGTDLAMMDAVHPRCYEAMRGSTHEISTRNLLRAIPQAVLGTIKRKLKPQS